VLRLNRIERELGADGSSLVHEVLILGMTMEQISGRRGLRGQRWLDYFAKRLRECLDRLALAYGFATEKRAKQRSQSSPSSPKGGRRRKAAGGGYETAAWVWPCAGRGALCHLATVVETDLPHGIQGFARLHHGLGLYSD
jgi:hypothetical protein